MYRGKEKTFGPSTERSKGTVSNEHGKSSGVRVVYTRRARGERMIMFVERFREKT